MANLTGQPVYQKGQVNRVRSRSANAAERARWQLVIAKVGCIPCQTHSDGGGRPTIHHIGTGIGRAKDHLATICLCWEHHQGKNGVDGKRMGKRVWEQRYGTEESLLAETNRRLHAKP